MKILITGTSGFLGKRAEKYFSENHTVFAPSHSEMDITCAESVNNYLLMSKPQFVLHCAAVSDVGQCEKQPEHSYGINVCGTKNLALACHKTGARLIFCSSDQVYFGSTNAQPHLENEALSPANVYGRQKLEGEHICSEFCPDSISLRLSWMYDPRRTSDNGHGDFMTIVRNAIDSEAPLTMPLHDMRGITDVYDVLHGIEVILSAESGVYNFGSENNMSGYETVLCAFKAAGINEALVSADVEKFADRPRNISMNTAKAKSAGASFPSTVVGIARAL